METNTQGWPNCAPPGSGKRVPAGPGLGRTERLFPRRAARMRAMPAPEGLVLTVAPYETYLPGIWRALAARRPMPDFALLAAGLVACPRGSPNSSQTCAPRSGPLPILGACATRFGRTGAARYRPCHVATAHGGRGAAAASASRADGRSAWPPAAARAARRLTPEHAASLGRRFVRDLDQSPPCQWCGSRRRSLGAPPPNLPQPSKLTCWISLNAAGRSFATSIKPQRVRCEFAPACHQIRPRNPRFYRKLVVGLRIDRLRRVRGEKLHQLQRGVVVGAAAVIATPEMFICVPPPSNTGNTMRTASAHGFCSGSASISPM